MSDTKDVVSTLPIRRHRVILPIYIPRLTGYFKDALEILSLCLGSLKATTAGAASVTLVANQCAPEALDAIAGYYAEGWIDQVVVNRENRGRIDAVVSVARGSHEPLLTISDSDVLFRQGWLAAVDSLFATYPECGMASIVPHPGAGWHHTSATVLVALSRRELGYEKVVSDEEIDRFGDSIGMPHWVKPEQRERQLFVRRNGTVACVGCPHFLFTIRREVVPFIPPEPCMRPLGAGSDELWYDRPPDVGGYWRLATPRSYADHLGNVPEPWMHDALARIASEAAPVASDQPIPPARRALLARLPYRTRQRIIACVRRWPLAATLRGRSVLTAAEAAETR